MLDNKSKSIKLFAGVIAVLVSTGFVWAQATTTAPAADESTAVLSAVPAEAWGAVLIKNMDKTSQMVDEYAKKLALETPGLERKLARMLGVSGQIDMTRPMALVVMSKDRYGQQPIALVVTAKEYEKFAADLKSKTTETAGVMKGSNEELGDVYFGKKDGFVVMGPTEAIVKSILGSKQAFSASLAPAAQKLLQKSDVYVSVNFQSLSQFLKPTLMGVGAMMQMGAMGGMGMGMGEDAQAPNAQAQAQMQAMQSAGAAINALVGFIDETNSFDIGLKLDPKVVHGGFMFNFKPGQEIAKMLAEQKQTDASLVRGVAGDDFALAAGYQWKSKMSKFQRAMLQVNPGFADPADFEKFKAVSSQLAEMGLGQSLKIAMLKPQPNQPIFEVQQVTETTDARKYVELSRQMFELQSKAKAGAGQMEFKYEQGVTQIEGVSVDKVTVDLTSMMAMPGVPPENAQQLQGVLKTLLGSQDNKVSFMMAPVTDKRIVVYFGGNAEGMGKFIKAAKAGATPLGTNTKVISTAQLLPKQRLMEGYIDLGTLASGFMAMAMMAGDEGQEMPATIPAIKTPLAGMAASVEGSALTLDVAVPFEVVQNLMSLRYMVPMPGMGSDSLDESDIEIEEEE